MAADEEFLEVVDNVGTRRNMYLCGGSFYEVCAYLSGYAAASADCALGGDGHRHFSRYISATFGVPSNYVWPYVLKQVSRDDDEAVERLRRLLTDFAGALETRSAEDVVEDARAGAAGRVEGEPGKTWRQFSQALWRGRQAEIRPLIQEHPDAEILWAGAYPADVAELLMEIDESDLVTRIAGSEEEGEVTVLTADSGPMSLKRIDGRWRIDATPVIRIRQSMQRPKG